MTTLIGHVLLVNAIPDQPITWQQLMAKRFLFFRPNIGMWKKCDQSDFDHGMIVGVRLGGLIIPKIVYREWWKKKKKQPVSGSSVGENALLLREVRGE